VIGVEVGAGSVIGEQYRLLSRLGGGGGGQVYRAQPLRGGRHVALKLLDQRTLKQNAMRERFEREARALNGLEHPHLIRLLDFGVHEAMPYLVTELLTGVPLDRLIAKKPLPPAMAFELGLGLIAGLAHAHAHGVLHRDLKPANVFIAILPGGALHPKLLDFGLARFVDQERWGKHVTVTEEGAVLGTPTYMPPEQGFGARADARSDVYSAGVVLYELFVGRPPFDGESRASIIRAHAMEPVPSMGAMRRGLIVERKLESTIGRALAKEPADRFEDAREMLRALQMLPEPPARLDL
jgi:eukaryotic-like serine/threonine-protein kinase